MILRANVESKKKSYQRETASGGKRYVARIQMTQSVDRIDVDRWPGGNDCEKPLAILEGSRMRVRRYVRRSPGRVTTYLREVRGRPRWGTRISRVHGENGANKINKSQREKVVEDGLESCERGTEKRKECETAISRGG